MKMKRIALLIVATAAVAGVIASLVPASGRADDEGRADLRNQNSRRIPRLEVHFRGP